MNAVVTDVFTTGPTWRAIGMDLPEEGRADEVLAEVSDRVELLEQCDNKGVYLYKDCSGAAIVFDVVDDKIRDLRQSVTAGKPTNARWVQMANGFALVDILGDNPQPDLDQAKPVAQACVMLQKGLLNNPGQGGSGQIRLAALTQKADLYKTREDYAASETARTFTAALDKDLPASISMGAHSALTGEPAHAGILLSGRVLEAEMHSNTMTGQDFWVITLDAGFPLTVCAGVGDLTERPRLDNVLCGEFVMLAAI